MRLGDLVEKIFYYSGIKWLHKKIWFDLLGKKDCGCDDRKDMLNKIKISRNGED